MIRVNGFAVTNGYNLNFSVIGNGISASSLHNGITASGAFKGRSVSSAVNAIVMPCAFDVIGLFDETALLNDYNAGVTTPVKNRLFHDLRSIN